MKDDLLRRLRAWQEGIPHADKNGLALDSIALLRLVNDCIVFLSAMEPSEPNIRDMVDRFLGWPLPKGFAPDCGISFDGAGIDPDAYKDVAGYRRSWPVGTNLFTATQAQQMIKHLLGDDLMVVRK